MGVALFFFLTFFCTVPTAFVQSLANIEGIEKAAPFSEAGDRKAGCKTLFQGVLPGIVLKIFLILLPSILMTMSKIGHTSLSALDRRLEVTPVCTCERVSWKYSNRLCS